MVGPPSIGSLKGSFGLPMSELTVGGADGQVVRAASKFALVAMASELAMSRESCRGPRKQKRHLREVIERL